MLPLLALAVSPRRVLGRVGATPPPLALVPWYVAAIVLLWDYPFSFTGEWVELLAGGLFVMSTGPVPAALWAIVATAGRTVDGDKWAVRAGTERVEGSRK